MRIGLLGGTFNPIHNGHLQIAEKVLSQLKLDRVFFIPTGKSPHKQGQDTASECHRRNMISLALTGHPHFVLCDIEIKSADVSYTVDTISALKQKNPEDTFFFIIGTDAFSKLSEWKEPERLLSLCHFVVVPRAGAPFSKKSEIGLTFLQIPLVRVSGSQIRARIKEKKSVNALLPQTVLSYIMKRGIYAKAEEENGKLNCRGRRGAPFLKRS
ncbi:MAG: nicotinate-nucleotide adenylyltransferase [Nitrospirae bacterium]|nr:nicotinate-nucleotide adenylyltransferase [Candidatus Troglogloeales bacterium]MBI3598479.1 nicotinate-nucleotide adenylyltransferase [Candidatus Troglogloeales bacterium]